MAIDVLLHAVMLRRPLTGIGQYTLRLGQGLEEHPDIDRVLYFDRFGWSSSRPRRAVVRPLKERVKQSARGLPFTAALYRNLRRACFRWTTRGAKVSLYHEPNYLLMPFDGPCVATLHDLSHIHYPQYHPLDRVRNMEKELPRTLKRADHFITVSNASRAEMISILGIPPDR